MGNRAKLSRDGVCKLTGERGTFVDSHLLPKALTKAEGLAPGLVQFGNGRKEKRSSSWYDQHLVVAEGEKILAHYDDWAIRILRKHAMVWSGWGPRISLNDYDEFPGSPWGLRSVSGDNWKKLRLFFLSLLWRAAATSRPEFNEIQIPADHLERLRQMVLNGDPEPVAFYAISLTQISTIGIRHNHAPIAFTKTIPSLEEGQAAIEEPTFRFYFDGLIIHFSRLSTEQNQARDLGPLVVGAEDTITLSTIEFERSAQAQNFAIVGMEAELGRPLFEIPYGPFSPERKIF
ncbi:hypothetical protein [Roseibium sp. M-1]